MNDFVKNAKGSPSRDIYKWLHKQIEELYGLKEAHWWSATDIDLLLVDSLVKNPLLPAFTDYKKKNEGLTKTEIKAYDDLLEHNYKVYIIKGDLPELPRDKEGKEIKLLKEFSPEQRQELYEAGRKLEVYLYIKGGCSQLISNNSIEWEKKLRSQ